MSLAHTENLFLYIGQYDDLAAAKEDYEAVKALHTVDMIGTYDAAVVTRTYEDKVKIVNHTEKPTQHGGWGGVAVGAAIGVIFPPAILGSALAGGAIGAIGGHLSGGLPHDDLKDLGNLLKESQAALVVIADPTLEKAVEKAVKLAKKDMKRQIRADAAELEREIDAIPAS